jgi:hypothetical protein
MNGSSIGIFINTWNADVVYPRSDEARGGWKFVRRRAIVEELDKKGRMMRELLVFSAVLAALSPTPVLAQISTGPRDGTTNVTSDRIGMPGGPTDPISQYQSQRAMNNLPDPDGRATASLGPARPAKSGELIPGAVVDDRTGNAMAKIESVDPDGVIVSMGAAKVKVPADAFGHNNAGLLIDMTKGQFEQVVAQANKAS